jgi:queuosine precursor transporter
VLPGTMSWQTFAEVAPTNYVLKILIAVSLTPLIYAGHWAIRRYLGRASA